MKNYKVDNISEPVLSVLLQPDCSRRVSWMVMNAKVGVKRVASN